MKVTPLELEGLKLVELDIFKDSRGFFSERYHVGKFKDLGLPVEFDQDNHSRSAPGVVRGLHYQYDPPQGKLVGCIRGKIWDVAVDIRPNSPSFGKHVGVELTGDNGRLLWMPAGFAHGFCVLGDEQADVLYKVTGTYNGGGEGGIIWNDSELGIQWPVDKPGLSEKDLKLPAFAEYRKGPAPGF